MVLLRHHVAVYTAVYHVHSFTHWFQCMLTFCSAGAVLQCLRKHRTSLTSECRKEELKLNILQSQDVRLQPTLHKQCSEEIAVFCPNVDPGVAPKHLPDHCHLTFAECTMP